MEFLALRGLEVSEIDVFTQLVLTSLTGKNCMAVSIGISLRRGILISSSPLVAIQLWSS